MNSLQILNSCNLGGAELVAINIAKSLNNKNFNSNILIPGEGESTKYCTKNGLHYNCIPCFEFISVNFTKNLIRNIYFRLFFTKKDSILHFHSPFIYGIFSKSLYFSKVRSVVHVHLETDDDGLKWAFRHPPDSICVCAEFLVPIVCKNLNIKKKFKPKISVLPNAVDLNKFYPGDKTLLRSKYKIENNVYFLLLVADLAPHKGQETAILSVAKIKNENLNVCLWLVGADRSPRGNYIKKLEKMISDLNLHDEVFIKGHRDDIPDLMRAADCLLLPSTREGLPLSILEAQASELPVIASPISGIPEVITDGVTGFLVNPSDWNEYANKIILLMNNIQLRNRISENALQNCLKYRGWDYYMNQLISIYNDIN